MHITHAYMHTHTYTQQYTYIHIHAYNIYFWGICKIVLCILRIQKLHANFDYGCAISSTTVAQSSESCSPLKSPLLLICWSIDDITQFCRSHYDTSGPEPINGFPSCKLQITHHKLSMAVVGVEVQGLCNLEIVQTYCTILRLQGLRNRSGRSGFGRSTFLASRSYDTWALQRLLHIRVWNCCLRDVMYQIKPFSQFTCPFHVESKTVTELQSSSSEAQRCYEGPSRQLKNKGEKFFSVLCTVLIGTTHLYVLPSAVAVPLQKTLCHPWIVQMYCAILSWHTVSGIWECSAQSQDCANS